MRSDLLPGRANAPDERIVYKRIAGHDLTLDVFHGRSPPSTGLPAGLLLFHGGAWEHGSAAQFHPQCQYFSQLGLTCISVEYRVRNRHGTSPADALQDARDAMRFVRRHASRLGIDPTRIAAGGGSAGGHLAAGLGVSLPVLGPSSDSAASWRPDALVLLNPMLDLSPGRPDHERVLPDWMALSPRHNIAPGLPPTLIVNGTADVEVPVATVQDFCMATKQSGGQCEVVLFEAAPHGFFNLSVQGGRFYRPSIDAVEAFLRRLGYL
jgi:acetyl esterase/lipase